MSVVVQHTEQPLIIGRMSSQGYCVVNSVTGELFQVTGSEFFTDGGDNILTVKYGPRGFGCFFVGDEKKKWLEELFVEVLIRQDDVLKVRNKKTGDISNLDDQQRRYVTCYAEHRDKTLTFVRFLIPRQDNVMFWHVRDFQN